jgi:putative DNA primase/helicase
MSTVSLADLLKEHDTSSHLITKSLINYCSEIGNLNGHNVDLDRFKKLASGEPIVIKLLYQDKFMVDNYSKLIVNGNELPPVPENSNAWFRRFLIIPFEQTYSGANKDMNLLNKILQDDGQNMFLNWIIDGYQRLKYRVNNLDECNDAWKNSKGYPFFYSKKIEDEISKYKINQASSYAFLTHTQISKNIEQVKDVYKKYLSYCSERFLKKQSRSKFIGALLEHGYKIDGEYIKNIKVNYQETIISFNMRSKDEEF